MATRYSLAVWLHEPTGLSLVWSHSEDDGAPGTRRGDSGGSGGGGVGGLWGGVLSPDGASIVAGSRSDCGVLRVSCRDQRSTHTRVHTRTHRHRDT